jgi:hypothetical protein
MMPPDLTDGNCQKFAPEELEETFWYPGPQDVAKTPGSPALRAWEQAKEVCIECPVFLMCRENSWGQEYGVVGGTDQHERHLHRRRLTRLLALKDDQERAAMAAYFHARHAGGLGDSPDLMARSTGYSSLSIKLMLSEHEALLDAQRKQAAAQADDAAPTEWEDTPSFPEASPPRADGWVWYYGRAYAGHYMGQTEDGAYVRMKIKPARAQTTKWLPVHLVDLRSTITPVVMEWINRPVEAPAPPALGRKTHCPAGHPYAGSNLAVYTNGARRCRKCLNAQKAARRRADGVQEKAQNDQRSGQPAA